MEKEKLTVASVKNFETEVDYTTVLENFEGPLDLLLYLIKQEEIEIKDIFVSQVTEQFLSYMKGLPYLDLDKASEYLDIAATIIDIKARSLLPPPDDEFEDYFDGDDPLDTGYDPKRDLIQALEEYQTAKKLKERETIGYIFKEPDKEFSAVQVQYTDMTLDGLMKAFAKMMLRRESQKRDAPKAREIPKDTFTVRDKIKHIRSTVAAREAMNFEELFSEEASTPEIVTTFQALLELLKHQFVLVEQEDLFSKIIIKKNPNRSEDEEIGEIDEYN
ncbi:MAG: segregation/condensation protein A [Clostridia bacterium]|nr:segregation/condensation protein A [Clostridia bacterium]